MTISFALALALLACACGGGSGGSSTSAAEPNPPSIAAPDPTPAPTPTPTTDCQTRDVYTLCVTLQSPGVNLETVGHMKELFFSVYPQLADRFNRGAPLSVYFQIGPSTYTAGASGNSVTYQAAWLIAHPQDYDVVVHEVMHIVQSYSSSPGWLTEGIADYVRYHYGVNNAAAGWQLQPPAAGQSYADGYGVTARFLVWVEARYKVELVDALHGAIRGGSYDAGLWILLTGKSVGELWSEYVADPALAAP